MKLGATDYLLKPIDRTVLRAPSTASSSAGGSARSTGG